VLLDPAVAKEGTTFKISLYAATLTSGGAPASGLRLALPRGTRVDRRASLGRCAPPTALQRGCPDDSRIGFGRSAADVTGFLTPGGSTSVAWSLTAFLAEPVRPGDLAAVVLRAQLLGGDRAGELLGPLLGGSLPLPLTSVAVGRLVPPRSSQYGPELQFDELPALPPAPANGSVSPTSLDLTIGAVRRVRVDFVRRVRVATPTGPRIRRIPDHRLVAYHLLRNPRTCRASWPYRVTVDFAGAARQHAGRVGCSRTLLEGR
jgi:hypothetical protein